MKKLLAQHHRTLEVLIHIISWVIVFTFPLLFVDRTSEYFTWDRFLRHSIVPLSFVVVFYLNYLWLIPRLLFREQTYKYIIFNLILVTVMGLGIHYIQEFYFTIEQPIRPTKRPPQPRWTFLVRDILGMCFTAGLSAIIRISRRWSKLESARREAEKQRTEAELKNLRNQLNPHFLLNTLNNIYALIAFDSGKAQQAVQELSKLLRHMLYDNQQTYVSLGKEAEFIYNYIELMRIRLSSNVKLETHLDIDKNSRTPITPLIFISLIENAFKHGISPTEPSRIYISLSEDNNRIICDIVNSNYPKTDQDKSGSGIGLSQVSKRLELLYKGQYTWEKSVSPDGKEYHSRLIIESGKVLPPDSLFHQ
ncbi:sensor histidine kinase [Bacteroides sp. 51]|uniref:sensor histidine kinase n=1 Tax=Bacteroides sp. 51 TaxID=2302938 RepID=UPI0013D101C9|nr:histidine kinase [Bacteroides sp. 51]NDV81968.1 sensor histidine kinase [Bacteroides sp. 51]